MQRNHHRTDRNERTDRDPRHLDGHAGAPQERTGYESQFAGGRRGGSMNVDNDRMADSYGQMNRGYDQYDRADYGYDTSSDQRDSRNVSRHFEANDNYGQGRFHDDRPVIGDRYGYDHDDRFGRSGHAPQHFDHDRDDGRWGRDHANAPGSYATYEDQRRMTARDGGSRYDHGASNAYSAPRNYDQSYNRPQDRSFDQASNRSYGPSHGPSHGPSYNQVYQQPSQQQQQRGGQYYGARDYRSSRTIGEPRYGASRDSVPHDFNTTNDYSYGRNHAYGMEDVRGNQGSDEWRGGYRNEEDHTESPRADHRGRRR